MKPEDDFDMKQIEGLLKDGDFRWDRLTNEKYLEYVHLQMPKFKFENSLDLKPALELLGITDLFTRGKADLKGMIRSLH